LHPLRYRKTCTLSDLSCIFITARGEPLTVLGGCDRASLEMHPEAEKELNSAAHGGRN